MAKRPNHRSVKSARTYTIDEAADTLCVSIGTIRSWVKSGLPLMKSRKPFLILGDSLRDFLQARAANSKVTLLVGQLYCLTCKAGREPLGMMVDCIPQTAKTARLTGLCDVCGGTCNQIISLSKINQISGIFDVAMKDVKTA